MADDIMHVKEEEMEVAPGFTKLATTTTSTELPKKRNINKKRNGFLGHEIDPFSKRQRTQTDFPDLDLQADFDQTIGNIIAKHGAIDKDCSLSSDLMKNLSLIGVWKILKELGNKNLEELELNSLQTYYNIVKDAERLNINMKWLLERLDDIKEAIVSRNAAKVLEGVKHDYIRKRDDKKGTLKRLQVEVKKIEDEIDEVDGEIKTRVAKFQKFQHRPVLDGLI